MSFKRNNHYIPKFYLSAWNSDDSVWTYSMLTEHENVPLWKQHTASGIAYYSHLYTKMHSNGSLSDEYERWFDKEFEEPTKYVLEKVTTNQKLHSDDWKKLINYVAAQYVRTPAYYLRALKRWNNDLPSIIECKLENSARILDSVAKHEMKIHVSHSGDDFEAPIRVIKEHSATTGMAMLRVDTFLGREMWFYEIKRVLTKLCKVLHRHNWSIVSPTMIDWVTSDDPVICLNYYDAHKYDFEGGWGVKNTDIFMPITPKHMVWTTVGKRNTSLKSFSIEKSELIQKMIIEHAHRYVFSKEINHSVEVIRPRIVDPKACDDERMLWKSWNDTNTSAEREMYDV